MLASLVPANINDVFLQAVGRHFVTMSCMQTPPGSMKDHAIVNSGFVIEVEGFWFYVTAGHVLRDIRSAMQAGSTFDVWRFGDQAARGPHKEIGIPFHFAPEEWIVIRDESVGTDYAALFIRDLYKVALASGEVLPLSKAAWGDHATEYDQWVLVGVPAETVVHDGESRITARLMSVAVKKVEAPEAAGEKAQNQFYARLIDGSESIVQNIEGMSGGPVFATKRVEDALKYTVIGIQSAWYRNSRVIAVCPFSSLGIGLESAIQELRKGGTKGAT